MAPRPGFSGPLGWVRKGESLVSIKVQGPFETGFAYQIRSAVGEGHSVATLLLDAQEKITVAANMVAVLIDSLRAG